MLAKTAHAPIANKIRGIRCFESAWKLVSKVHHASIDADAAEKKPPIISSTNVAYHRGIGGGLVTFANVVVPQLDAALHVLHVTK